MFTGRGVHPGNIREALAAKHGFTISSSYRPEASFVVLGSESVTTAAANAAKEHGAHIVLETDFWRRCGEL